MEKTLKQKLAVVGVVALGALALWAARRDHASSDAESDAALRFGIGPSVLGRRLSALGLFYRSAVFAIGSGPEWKGIQNARVVELAPSRV